LRIHRERIAAEAVAERDAFRERLAFRKAIGPEFTRRITEGYMLDTGEIATREVTA
jgi:hypothetical protein